MIKDRPRIRKLTSQNACSCMFSSNRWNTFRIQMLLMVSFTIFHSHFSSAFNFPGGICTSCHFTAKPCDRGHGVNSRIDVELKHANYWPVLSKPRRSVLLAKSSQKDDEDSEPEKKEKLLKRVGKLGSRVISRLRKPSDEASQAIPDEEPPETTLRSKRPLLKSNTLDPFQSEVALAKELSRQKALDQYISGDAYSIPDELLPRTPTGQTPGVNQAVATIDDSLAFVRGKLSTVRLNLNDESNSVFLTPKQEQQRLNQIRRDLEIRREKLIVEEKKRKTEQEAKSKAQSEKMRMAMARTKREKTAKIEKERQKKVRAQRQNQILGAAKGLDIEPMVEIEDKPIYEEKEDDADTGPLTISKSRVGSFVDGVMSSAQSTIGSAWQVVKSTKKKDDDGWITVCPKTRISPGEVYPAVAGGLDLLIIGSKDGTKVHCISNSCPHLGTPLETGMVERRPCPKKRGPIKQSNGLATNDNTKIPTNDGMEECIVCPLHNTAFALDNGEVRGEWCPYPPIIGKVMGTVKTQNNLTTFQMRSRGKMLQIKIFSKIET